MLYYQYYATIPTTAAESLPSSQVLSSQGLSSNADPWPNKGPMLLALAQGHVLSPLSFIQNFSQEVAQLCQIFEAPLLCRGASIKLNKVNFS